MTILEFWGCSLITFGPALAIFTGTIAHDPIKIIVLISAAFFWLLSFLLVSIIWAIIRQFCDYLVVGAYLAVLSQEFFRFVFHMITKRAQVFLSKLMNADNNRTNSVQTQTTQNDNNNRDQRQHDASIRTNASTTPSSARSRGASTSAARGPNERIEMSGTTSSHNNFHRDILPLSYVSGLGFGLINAAFSMTNVLTDYIGPGTVGLKGDSMHFLLVSSVTALAFLLLNVAWSIMMSASIEKQDRRLTIIVVLTHLIATTITFFNQLNLQLISVGVVYLLTALCGLLALKSAEIDPRSLLKSKCSAARTVS